MSDAQHSEYSHLTMIGLILLWLGRYFAWGETRAWIDDYFGYYEGTGYKKMSFAEPGKFVNCAGTIEQLRDQVGSLLNGMNPIRGLLRRGIAMEPAYEILEMLVMNLIAEWRTYFYQNGYDPIRMPNNEMNRLADLSYNRWRFFLASVQQLKSTTPATRVEALCIIDGFIRDQEEALRILNEREETRVRNPEPDALQEDAE